ncbi:unnamed protein product [Trichogramma brassicae]|uniref:Uncharacterized protein n=1 Tax=Trichogramma brassicae TaxID=86971 RepID=A0A6H5J6F3_9HYME|nr:unnamed protein product [Trichogramma brassicae]
MSLLVRRRGQGAPRLQPRYGGEGLPLLRISGWGKKTRERLGGWQGEQKAALAAPAEATLPRLAVLQEEYAARRLTPDAFLTVLRDLWIRRKRRGGGGRPGGRPTARPPRTPAWACRRTTTLTGKLYICICKPSK